jgi:hypothetical protein
MQGRDSMANRYPHDRDSRSTGLGCLSSSEGADGRKSTPTLIGKGSTPFAQPLEREADMILINFKTQISTLQPSRHDRCRS